MHAVIIDGGLSPDQLQRIKADNKTLIAHIYTIKFTRITGKVTHIRNIFFGS